MDYTKLSNDEINSILNELEKNRVISEYRERGFSEINTEIALMEIGYGDGLDYCNSWEDMGKVIESEKITVDAPFGKDRNWQASYWSDKTNSFEFESDHLNPLRAAAIVAIQVLKAKQ